MEESIFYKLRNVLKEQKIVFCYSGYMTEKILTAIGETIKKKLEIEGDGHLFFLFTYFGTIFRDNM